MDWINRIVNMQLKDRNKQIPNGLRFYIPELKWNAPGPYASFTRICDAVEGVLKANPGLAQQNNWPSDRTAIENWVDAYNTQLCAQMGWGDYITDGGGASVPKSNPHYLQQTLQSLRAAAAHAKELVVGAKTLGEWIDSGDPAVSRDLSTSRAFICSKCPKNETGDWTKLFTVPAAELIERKMALARERKLSTVYDDQLRFCGVCSCPLQLKVHVPIQWIGKTLTPELMEKFKAGNPSCWILMEAPSM